jgi:hypothetical protein
MDGLLLDHKYQSETATGGPLLGPLAIVVPFVACGKDVKSSITYMYIHICRFMFTCVNTYRFIDISIYMFMYICVCIYIYIYIHMCICIFVIVR